MPSYRLCRVGKSKASGPRVELLLKSTLQSVGRAERLIRKFCQQTGCSPQQRDEIALAVRESVANAVLHGNCSDANKKVAVAAELRDFAVVISVKDEGPGFDLQALPDPRDPRNLLRETGRGVFLINACMDRVTLRRPASCGMEVTMVKYLSTTALRRATK